MIYPTMRLRNPYWIMDGVANLPQPLPEPENCQWAPRTLIPLLHPLLHPIPPVETDRTLQTKTKRRKSRTRKRELFQTPPVGANSIKHALCFVTQTSHEKPTQLRVSPVLGLVTQSLPSAESARTICTFECRRPTQGSATF
jgi:hypothetical protein